MRNTLSRVKKKASLAPGLIFSQEAAHITEGTAVHGPSGAVLCRSTSSDALRSSAEADGGLQS